MIVALTQAHGRLLGLEAALIERGHKVLRLPLVRVETLEHIDRAALEACPWWLFSSTSAIEALQAHQISFRAHRIGVIAEASAQAVRDAGGTPEIISPNGNALGLAQAFLEHAHTNGPVGLPQGDQALPTLQQALEAAGPESARPESARPEVRPITVYRTHSNPWPHGTTQPDVIVLASPSAVRAVPEHIACKAQLIALGDTTASSLTARNLTCTVAAHPNVHAVLEAIARLEPTPT